MSCALLTGKLSGRWRRSIYRSTSVKVGTSMVVRAPPWVELLLGAGRRVVLNA